MGFGGLSFLCLLRIALAAKWSGPFAAQTILNNFMGMAEISRNGNGAQGTPQHFVGGHHISVLSSCAATQMLRLLKSSCISLIFRKMEPDIFLIQQNGYRKM